MVDIIRTVCSYSKEQSSSTSFITSFSKVAQIMQTLPITAFSDSCHDLLNAMNF